eukprot:scaffold1237_cov243-Pinguiococcus_pyrenoidosus.AAC.40
MSKALDSYTGCRAAFEVAVGRQCHGWRGADGRVELVRCPLRRLAKRRTVLGGVGPVRILPGAPRTHQELLELGGVLEVLRPRHAPWKRDERPILPHAFRDWHVRHDLKRFRRRSRK